MAEDFAHQPDQNELKGNGEGEAKHKPKNLQ